MFSSLSSTLVLRIGYDCNANDAACCEKKDTVDTETDHKFPGSFFPKSDGDDREIVVTEIACVFLQTLTNTGM